MKQAETEPKEPQWKDQPIAALGGRTWAELETSRHDSGRLLFKDQLRRRGPTGELEAIEVRVAVPTPTDHVLARAEARAWFGRHKELDADRDAEIFDELEQICLLARAVRTAKAPHPQLADAAELGGTTRAAYRTSWGACRSTSGCSIRARPWSTSTPSG